MIAAAIVVTTRIAVTSGIAVAQSEVLPKSTAAPLTTAVYARRCADSSHGDAAQVTSCLQGRGYQNPGALVDAIQRCGRPPGGAMYDYGCIDLIPADVFSAAIPPAQTPPVVTPSPTVVPAQPTTVLTTPSTEDTSEAPSAEPSTLPTNARAIPVPTSSPSPWYAAIVTPPYLFVVIAIIIAAVVWRLRLLLPPRCPKCSKKEPHVHSLTITGPADASIAIAGRATLFSAEAEPPQLAAKIRWSIATQSGTSQTLGNGRNFSYVFGATGVEQVLAHLDDDGLTCGVVVYVFKTPGGGSTLADLLRSEPPPAPRSVAALKHWPRSASKLASGDTV